MKKFETTITIKTNKKLRDEAKKTAKRLGVPLGTAMNAMLRQFVSDEALILSVKQPSEQMKKTIHDLRAGKGERFTGSTEEFFTMLDRS